MSPLDKLGVAISDTGITWTNEMRFAWDAAKNAELASIVAMASTSSDAGRLLADILARIHGDGGHYVAEHGLSKAAEDADRILVGLRGNAEDARRWRYVKNFQDLPPQVDPFMSEMWRKSDAAGKRQPSGDDLEAAIDAALDQQAEPGESK